MTGVLFVCLANRFRSPLAAGLLAPKQPDADWRIESAGTWTEPGLPAHPFVVRYAARHGVNLRDHRSRPVTADLLRSFDLVLVMESGQREALRVEFPEYATRVCLLSEVVSGLQFDVPDPLGSRDSDFEEIANEVRQIIDTGNEAIFTRAKKAGNVP